MRLQYVHDRGDAAALADARGRQALQVHALRQVLHPARAAAATSRQAQRQHVSRVQGDLPDQC